MSIEPKDLPRISGRFESEFYRGRAFQDELCTPKLTHYKRCLEALLQISTIKNSIPFDAAEAATECIRLAKQTLKGQP